MFWSKKKEVFCNGCGCHVKRDMAQKVAASIKGIGTDYEGSYFYCRKCTVPYEKVLESFYSGNNLYYKEFSVDKKTGEPIGYTKNVPVTRIEPSILVRSEDIFKGYEKSLLETKVCGKCKTEKPLHKFHNDKASKDGKCYNCKACMKAANKLWLARKRLERQQAKLKVTHNV